jgi:hypothetical protein
MFSLWLDFLKLFGNLSEDTAFMITSLMVAIVSAAPIVSFLFLNNIQKFWWLALSLFISLFLIVGGTYFYSSYILKEWNNYFYSCTTIIGTVDISTAHFTNKSDINIIDNKNISIELCQKKEYLDSDFEKPSIRKINFVDK